MNKTTLLTPKWAFPEARWLGKRNGNWYGASPENSKRSTGLIPSVLAIGVEGGGLMRWQTPLIWAFPSWATGAGRAVRMHCGRCNCQRLSPWSSWPTLIDAAGQVWWHRSCSEWRWWRDRWWFWLVLSSIGEIALTPRAKSLRCWCSAWCWVWWSGRLVLIHRRRKGQPRCWT